MRKIILVLLMLVIICEFNPSFSETTFSIRLTSTYLEYNNSVGNEWGFSASANNTNLPYGESITFSSKDLPIRLSVFAVEHDKYSDHGSNSIYLDENDFRESYLSLSTIVQEDRGRYAGNSAKAVFEFSLSKTDSGGRPHYYDETNGFFHNEKEYNAARYSYDEIEEIREVLFLEEYLENLNTGRIDAEFILAVIKLQIDYNLDADGLIGPKTYEVISQLKNSYFFLRDDSQSSNSQNRSHDTQENEVKPVSIDFSPEVAYNEEGHFSLYSSKKEVKEVHGNPDSIIGDTWYYWFSSVTFKNDSVSGWLDPPGILKVSIGSRDPNYKGIFVGATMKEVTKAMGTPDTFSNNTWWYGHSRLLFENGILVDWKNVEKNLNISNINNREIVEIGLSKKDVLRIVGKPSKQNESVWHYGLSYIIFLKDKVIRWSNGGKNLPVNE